ncbi:hypothetical protein NQ315_008278 [Exocentrus adspersus]|uniref:DUF5641 domain-containing protein n=1 Tax=Exocentrus adspersus TaxID=1586481 RepID=A0AAV8VM18_9CUCU|nr:hypothetical protein NQ315_008278 [Exocentrus adspersus]
MVQLFWSRWAKEYIGQLQAKSKWKQSYPEKLKPDVLVLIKEDGLPPLKWLLERVLNLSPGPDGVVRAATIKLKPPTAAGMFGLCRFNPITTHTPHDVQPWRGGVPPQPGPSQCQERQTLTFFVTHLSNRHCVLMFDEISLDPSLTYDMKSDSVSGFEDIDGKKQLKFADHALVFMLRGLRKKWKRPISFHFTQGGINADKLKVLIKETIIALQDIGFVISCIVCDQYSANINAIKRLGQESTKQSATDIDLFEIGGQEIVAHHICKRV